MGNDTLFLDATEAIDISTIDLDDVGGSSEGTVTGSERGNVETEEVDMEGPAPREEKDISENVSAVSETGEESEFYYIAEHWKQVGVLPEDMEIKKDLNSEELEAIYRARVGENVRNEVRTEMKDDLAMRGYNLDQILAQTESHEEIRQKEYDGVSRLNYNQLIENGEDIDELIEKMGKEYYYSKSGDKLEEGEVELLLENDLGMDEEDRFEKYRSYFESRSIEMFQEIEKKREAVEAQEREKTKQDAEKIKEILNNGELSGKKFSKKEAEQLYNALYKKDQVYDDGKGTRRRVTLYEKKRLEAQGNLEAQLALAAFLVLGGTDLSIVKERAEKKGAADILNKIGRASGITHRYKSNSKFPEDIEEMFLED